MPGGKTRIDFHGTAEILQKIEAAGGKVQEACIKALSESMQKPKQEMLDFIKKHRRTGRTEASWTEEIKTKGDKIYVELGFDIKRGGIAALFLNVGTPTIQPSFFIDNAVEHNLDEIKKAQLKALNEVFKELK